MTQAVGSLGSNIRKVTLQFSMSHGNQVPRWVAWIEPETYSMRNARKTSYPEGELFLFPEEDESGRGVNTTSLLGIVEDLESAGYILTEAIAQERLAAKPGVPPYAMVRYTFYRRELALRTPDFIRHEANIMADLREFLELATWRVRGYQNPYIRPDGTVLEGFHGISINMEARSPLYVGNDKSKPQVRWQKDANGERVGDAPIRVVAQASVAVVDGGIFFVTPAKVVADVVVGVKSKTEAGSATVPKKVAVILGGTPSTAMSQALLNALSKDAHHEHHLTGDVLL